MGHMLPDGSYYCVCCEHGKRMRWPWLIYGFVIGFALGAVGLAVLSSALG